MVGDGQAALDAAMELRPNVVVLDISMPILNGIQAARRLQQADSDAKIVFLTVEKDLISASPHLKLVPLAMS